MVFSLLAATVFFLSTLASAGISTFQITQPEQCSPMNITWVSSGSISSTSYNLVLIPTSTTDETQVLSNISFTAPGQSYTLPVLPLAKNVEFIALLKDGTDNPGRVSQIVTTSDADGAGTDCLANLPHYLDFVFSIEFANQTSQPNQCATTTVYDWGNATDPIGITGLIPGGESFNIPITNVAEQRADWTTTIPSGTNVMFIMSDGGARGSGGSTGIYTVGTGSSSCLTSTVEVYSSLPIGEVPTTQTVTETVTASSGPVSSTSAGVVSDSSKKSDTGAIVGGVVGGVAGLALLAAFLFWFFKRRGKKEPSEKEEMMGVARPWSPPVPEDPENVRTTFLGGSGRGTTASYASQRPSDSLDTPSQSVYQLPIVNASQYPPSSFSHVPPGSVRMSAYAASTESLSEGRGWSEKRPGGIGSSESRHSPTTEGDELLVPSEEVSSGHQRNHSHPRFVRHEDGGLMESASEGVPHQEVVDLPPLYQDAGRSRTSSVAREEAAVNNSRTKAPLHQSQ